VPGADTETRNCVLEKTKRLKKKEPLLRSTHRGNVKCVRLQHFSSKNMKETNVLGRSRHKWVHIQGGSNMTGTDFYVNKPHCAAAVRP